MGGTYLAETLGRGSREAPTDETYCGLDHNLVARSPRAIRRPLEGGGNGALPHEDRGDWAKCLASVNTGPRDMCGMPLQVEGAEGTPHSPPLPSVRPERPATAVRYRENGGDSLAPHVREARGTMASPIRGHGAVPCGSGDRGEGDRRVPGV